MHLTSFLIGVAMTGFILAAFLYIKERRKLVQLSQLQEESKRSLSLLKATLESTADGILVVDNNGRMVRFNRKFIEMWKIPDVVVESGDDSLAIRFVLDQLKDPEGFTGKIRELYEQRDALSFDTLEFKDGRIFERYSQPQKVESLTVGRVWSFRDVTNQRRAEESLRQKSEELSRSNRELDQFAQIASHDLREPLNLVIAYVDRICETAGEELKKKEKCRYYLERIRVAAERMSQLTSDLLCYARISPILRDREPIALSGLLQEIIQDLEFSIEKNQGKVDIGPLPTISGNRSQIRQLFQNLIVNSLKFCRPDSCPLIKIIEVSSQGGQCTLCVEDNGIGFDPQFASEIFKPFCRLHGGSEFEGSGLGLALCEKIVIGHGGKIWAQSEPGRGSKFYLTIPLDS